MKPRRVKALVRVLFCSAKCSARFRREIGGDPMLHAFGQKPEAKCSCGTPLSEKTVALGYRTCRMCRLGAAVRRAVAREIKRNERLRKTIAAERMARERAAALPLEEAIE